MKGDAVHRGREAVLCRQSVLLPLTTYLQDLYAHTLRSHHSGGDNTNRSTLGEA